MCKFTQKVYTYYVILQYFVILHRILIYMWILLSNIDLRCEAILLQIYAFLSVKFSGREMCECKKMTNMRYADV